MSDTQL